MTVAILRFVTLLFTSLLVGAMFGIWMHFDPALLSPASYVEQQQQAIRGLNTLMPIFGAACILLTTALAILERRRRTICLLLIGVALCLVASGLVTRFLNQPINSQVVTWNADAPPTDWTDSRDRWWHWHTVRTFSGVTGLSLLILATQVQPPRRHELRASYAADETVPDADEA